MTHITVNMENCRRCTKCDTLKYKEDFYRRANGTLYNRCKQCQKKMTAAAQSKRKEKQSLKPYQSSELIVTRRLWKAGIPAAHFESFCDLLAFGLVQIEIKTVYDRNRIQFTYTQRIKGLHGDIIALLWDDDIYFMNPKHPKLYNKKSGKLKCGTSINQEGITRSGSPLYMSDLWTFNEGILEIRRIMNTKINQLKSGVDIDSLLQRQKPETNEQTKAA